MHLGGCGEQPAVSEWDAGVEPVGRPLARSVEPFEEATEVVPARALRLCEQALHDPSEAVLGNHRQVLGEHRPDALEDEVAERFRTRGLPISDPVVELGHESDRLPGQLGLVLGEERLAAAKKVEGLVPVRQLPEREGSNRPVPERARLEDLELREGAHDDEPARGPGLAAHILPVPEGLLPVIGEALGLARSLHLDDADARPDHVDEPGPATLLK
ncbi:MAG: hypothetical protein WD067_08615 [Gaiellaceae bacterium]